MNTTHETSSSQRSATGFVLAITLAMCTFWGAGLVFQLHSYVADQPMQRAAVAASPDGACRGETDDAAPCRPEIRR